MILKLSQLATLSIGGTSYKTGFTPPIHPNTLMCLLSLATINNMWNDEQAITCMLILLLKNKIYGRNMGHRIWRLAFGTAFIPLVDRLLIVTPRKHINSFIWANIMDMHISINNRIIVADKISRKYGRIFNGGLFGNAATLLVTLPRWNDGRCFINYSHIDLYLDAIYDGRIKDLPSIRAIAKSKPSPHKVLRTGSIKLVSMLWEEWYYVDTYYLRYILKGWDLDKIAYFVPGKDKRRIVCEMMLVVNR